MPSDHGRIAIKMGLNYIDFCAVQAQFLSCANDAIALQSI